MLHLRNEGNHYRSKEEKTKVNKTISFIEESTLKKLYAYHRKLCYHKLYLIARPNNSYFTISMETILQITKKIGIFSDSLGGICTTAPCREHIVNIMCFAKLAKPFAF